MNTFTYELVELPLVIAGDIEAALIGGQAEIEYRKCGDWQIRGISLEGRRHHEGISALVYIPAPMPLASVISSRLEVEWFGRVQEAVNERIEEDHEAAADDYADMRRDERMLEE